MFLLSAWRATFYCFIVYSMCYMQSAVRQKKPYMSDNIIYKKIIFEKIQNLHSIIQLNSYFNVFVKNKPIFFLES